MTHDEHLFQRVNKIRSELVGKLRFALTSAGLRERRMVPAPVYKDNMGGIQASLQSIASVDDGYDIENVIKKATEIRLALAPFDSSLPNAEPKA